MCACVSSFSFSVPVCRFPFALCWVNIQTRDYFLLFSCLVCSLLCLKFLIICLWMCLFTTPHCLCKIIFPLDCLSVEMFCAVPDSYITYLHFLRAWLGAGMNYASVLVSNAISLSQAICALAVPACTGHLLCPYVLLVRSRGLVGKAAGGVRRGGDGRR